MAIFDLRDDMIRDRYKEGNQIGFAAPIHPGSAPTCVQLVSDAETDKYDYVSIVEFKAISTYRTRSATKKRTRVQRNLQL